MNKVRPEREFILGLPEPVATVPAHVAAFLERRFDFDSLRQQVLGEDRQIDQVLNAVHTVATWWRSSVAGTDAAAPPEPAPTLKQWFTTQEAALALGIGDRAIRKAIALGHLKAVHIDPRDHRWWIALEDLAQYRSTRQNRR